MEKKNVIYLYNPQLDDPDHEIPSSLLNIDFLDKETIELQKASLKEYFNVISLVADENAYMHLMELRQWADIVCNLSEGLYTLDSEAQFAAICDVLQIPYTGAGVAAQAIIQSKSRTKEVLKAHDVPTLPFQVYRRGDTLKVKKFPLMLKLNDQGSSIGLSDDSVVETEEEFYEQADWLVEHFNQGVMVEPFVTGREFTVSMIGNPPRIFPIIEKDYSWLADGQRPISGSIDVREAFTSTKIAKPVIAQAEMSHELEEQIKDMCRRGWDVIGCRDWARFDVRCDTDGNPFILEVNAPCGLTGTPDYPASFVLAVEIAGFNYAEMMREIVLAGLSRYEKRPGSTESVRKPDLALMTRERAGTDKPGIQHVSRRQSKAA